MGKSFFLTFPCDASFFNGISHFCHLILCKMISQALCMGFWVAFIFLGTIVEVCTNLGCFFFTKSFYHYFMNLFLYFFCWSAMGKSFLAFTFPCNASFFNGICHFGNLIHREMIFQTFFMSFWIAFIFLGTIVKVCANLGCLFITESFHHYFMNLFLCLWCWSAMGTS